MSSLHRVSRLSGRRGIGRADIQRQNNVSAQLVLDLHHALRCEHVRRSIQVRFKRSPLLAQFAQMTQAKDLKAAAVSQDRTIPAHKRVEPPEFSD